MIEGAKRSMNRPRRQRMILEVVSVLVLVALYTLVSNAYRLMDVSALAAPLGQWLRPEVLPPTQTIVDALWRLVMGGAPAATHEGRAHLTDHVGHLVEQEVTLQGSLAISTARVLIGMILGAPLGFLVGLAMGWSRRIDDYVHPLYILLRSVPPLALITYAMLWLGHGEAHVLAPIVYAVFATVVIPTYHGVRDVGEVYVRAARALGAGGWLLARRVVLPAASPAILGGLRYALMIAWMTTVGAEMLMADVGVGHLLVGGGLWSSRDEVRADPAAIMVGILGLATVGAIMDGAARVVIGHVTSWTRARRPW
jgi:ABC-type nitrate/sulfonate/bicarbonate transport system permease component